MAEDAWKPDLGAIVLGTGSTRFRVWAPRVAKVGLQLVRGEKAETVPMLAEEGEYFSATLPGVGDGDRYCFIPGENPPRPDPASRFQPDGVHLPSQVVDPRSFSWHDRDWRGIPLEQCVFYELHVGAFSPEGTFAGVIPHLDHLRDLGITVVEIMPVAQFPGSRNWGYDGVYPYAPQNSYGGPRGLKELVDACHGKGLAVALDVVYNHFGPEGNYLHDFGYYFTDRYRTPWGDAINFDGPYSDPVREYFIGNALYWINEFHFDALRLDAIDRIYDFGARHFLQQLAEEVSRRCAHLQRHIHIIAESDLNDVRLINPPQLGGYGMDAQWNDNFHHALHTLLTGENVGYYQDFGSIDHLAKAFAEGFVYTGQYSSYRSKNHGNSAKDRPPSQFVVFSQNHDQVGNRLLGDRLAATLSLDKLKLAAGVVILSPYLPLLFMGEEYGELAPFQYFVSYGDTGLIEAVRRGRREEFAAFQWQHEAVDPQDEATFLDSKLNHSLRQEGDHALLLSFHRALLALRRELPALHDFQRKNTAVTQFAANNLLAVRRHGERSVALCLFSFSEKVEEVFLSLPAGRWRKVLDSTEKEWGGAGAVAPESLAATERDLTVRVGGMSVLVYQLEG